MPYVARNDYVLLFIQRECWILIEIINFIYLLMIIMLRGFYYALSLLDSLLKIKYILWKKRACMK